jgi:hypothetical protein
MARYENRAEVDKLAQLQEEVNEVEEQALCNMDKMIERGEKIEVLLDKTNVLSDMSYDMNNQAAEVRRRMWWKRMRVRIAIAGVCLIAVALVVLLVAA